jgi:hypothetical protein
MSISIDDVMEAYKSLGGGFLPQQALQAELRKRGFGVLEIVDAIDEAVKTRRFSIDKTGLLHALESAKASSQGDTVDAPNDDNPS